MKFKISAYYEEGFLMEVEADNIEAAKTKANQLLNDYAECRIDDIKTDVLNREFDVLD